MIPSEPKGSPALGFSGPASDPLERWSRVAGASGKQGLVIVFGLGLGRHLRALAAENQGSRLAVFDPNHQHSEAYFLLAHEKDKFKGMEVMTDWAELDEFLGREIVHGGFPRPVVSVCPGYEKLMPGELASFRQTVRAAVVRRAVIDRTLREKSDVIIDNLSRNLPHLPGLPILNGLKGRLAGWPGFIVGSGPGLEKNVDQLRKLGGQGYILAAASAERPLAAAGVRPGPGGGGRSRRHQWLSAGGTFRALAVTGSGFFGPPGPLSGLRLSPGRFSPQPRRGLALRLG